ncbi:DUF6747 family protein [Sungkyunkwania multivorans]|uniref:DUF6747 family protein n=1 Tax=Sungkyunkwania multivorans TaxID=1173618 RepID=A0ABW3D0D3_9FLAO
MTTLLQFTSIFSNAFNQIENAFVAFLFKVATMFCVGLIATIIFAFVYRLTTGFAF